MRNFRINLKKVEEKNPFIGCKYCETHIFNFSATYQLCFDSISNDQGVKS